jgi:nickel-dependent lactate racemase
VPRVPLLAGSGVVTGELPEDAAVLRPPAPKEVVADVAAAVQEALRFPLEGPALEELARNATRATIVVELPSLPIPGAPADPRQWAVEGAAAELERAGIPSESQTLLVAGGLARRPGPGDIAPLVRPEFRRRFRGRVVVHDVEDDRLLDLGLAGNVPLRINPALVETDVVVVVSAAESVVHGGPSALTAAAGPEALRAAGAWSLLETAA